MATLFLDTQTIDVTAQNTGTPPICIRRGGYVNVSVYNGSAFVGTATLQRAFENIADTTQTAVWRDVKSYTANNNAEDVYLEGGAGTWMRVWVKTGNYTSGTISLRISYSGLGGRLVS